MKKILLAFLLLLSIPFTTSAALKNSNTWSHVPAFNPWPTGANGFQLTAAGFKTACIFRIPNATSSNKIGFYATAVASTTVVEARLETVSTSTGAPTGSLWVAGATATTSIATSSTGWKTISLGATSTFVAGDIVAAVIVASSSVTNNITINQTWSWMGNNNFPYCDSYNNVSWTNAGVGMLGMALYEPNGNALKGIFSYPANNTITDTTTTEEGELFSFNTPKYLCGFNISVRTVNASTTLTLYDSANNALKTVNYWKSQTRNIQGPNAFIFDTPVSLTANSQYRVAAKAIGGSTITLQRNTFLSTSEMTALEYYPTFAYTQRATSGAAWADASTSVANFMLYTCGDDDGVQVGGGSAPTPNGWGFIGLLHRAIDQMFALATHFKQNLALFLKEQFAMR